MAGTVTESSGLSANHYIFFSNVHSFISIQSCLIIQTKHYILASWLFCRLSVCKGHCIYWQFGCWEWCQRWRVGHSKRPDIFDTTECKASIFQYRMIGTSFRLFSLVHISGTKISVPFAKFKSKQLTLGEVPGEILLCLIVGGFESVRNAPQDWWPCVHDEVRSTALIHTLKFAFCQTNPGSHYG